MTERKKPLLEVLRVSGGVVAGLLLFGMLLVVSGCLAALPVSKGYFDWFGKGNAGVALAVINTATYTLPVSFLVAEYALVVPKLFGSTDMLVLGAMILSFLVAYGVQMDSAAYRWANWFQYPVLLAPWLGLAIAWVIRRSALSMVRANHTADA